MKNEKFNRLISFVWILISVSICYSTATELEHAAKSNGNLIFYLDTAGFRSSIGQTFQEFYYQIPLSQLEFLETEQGYVDTVYVNIIIFDSLDQKVYSDSSMIPVMANELASVEESYLPDQFDLIVEPGQYRVEMTMTESNGEKSGHVSLPFTVRNFTYTRLFSSDIQFCSNIQPDTADSKFVKNNLLVLPNPSRVYSFSFPMLYFYCEIYNLFNSQTERPASGTYRIEYDILDMYGDVVKTLPSKVKEKPGTSIAEVGAVNVGTLPDTLYQLRITVTDNDSKEKSTTTRAFRIVPLQIPAAPANEAELTIRDMSDEQLSKHFRQLLYILTNDERKILSKLSSDRLRLAIINYWVTNDPTPETPQNEFLRDYMGRIELVNKRFGSGFEKGWKTDRGRIMIKYGVPNDINNHPMAINSVPYIEWIYYRQEGIKFIFADEDGFNRYRLIFSSDERELTDPNWARIIHAY